MAKTIYSKIILSLSFYSSKKGGRGRGEEKITFCLPGFRNPGFHGVPWKAAPDIGSTGSFVALYNFVTTC